MLTAEEMAQMRAVQEAALPNTAVILRFPLVSDGMGGYIDTWQPTGTAPCRVSSVNSRAYAETEQGLQLVSETRWVVTLPAGTEVSAKDQLQVGDVVYEVTEVNAGEDWMTAVRAQVTRKN